MYILQTISTDKGYIWYGDYRYKFIRNSYRWEGIEYTNVGEF